MTVSLEQKLDIAWDEINNNLGYPNLKFPKIVKNSGGMMTTAAINMVTKTIVISEEFMNGLGMPIDKAFKGISAHEVNHYVTCPYDLKTMLLINHEVKKVDKANSRDITNYFEDVIINLDLIKRGITEISDVYKGMDSSHVVDETIKELYNRRTNHDFGVKDYNNVIPLAVDELHKLDYDNLEIKALRKNARKFATIISPLLKHDKEEDKKFPDRKYAIIDDHWYNSYSSGEIYNVAKEIAEEVSPKEYKQIIDDLKKNLSPEQRKALDTTKETYYKNLSEKYNIKVLKKTNTVGIQEKSYSTKEWDYGSPIKNVDFIKSKGIIFPGMTLETTFIQEPVEEERNDSEAIPDALIAIDSSGSMINPASALSYAALGGLCVAKFYLNNKKEVGVMNFSSTSEIQKFSSDKDKVYKKILDYAGGGTLFDTDKLDKMIDRECDLYIITDMGLSNFDESMHYLESNQHLRRTNIFMIDTYFQAPKQTNLTIHQIKDEKDIPKIVIKDFNKIT